MLQKPETSDQPTVPRSVVIVAEKHFTKSSQAVEALEETFKVFRYLKPEKVL